MFQKCIIIYILTVGSSHTAFGFFDPITIGLGAAVLGGIYNFQYLKEKTYCVSNECCIDTYIPDNVNGLYYHLNNNLFGQHIIINNLIPALRTHRSINDPKKPLVLSFHGTTGTGKNFVSDAIAQFLYKEGSRSQYVHKYLGRNDFPIDSYVRIYQERLRQEIIDSVRKCPRSLFIFDEVEKMPSGVFDSITPLLEHHSFINGYDFRKAIFIFLSNSAGTEIGDKLLELMEAGTKREDTKLRDFEKLAELGSYNINGNTILLPLYEFSIVKRFLGGLKKTAMIESSLIDHFFPFLPLEKRHVEKCISGEFRRYGRKPSDEQIAEVIQDATTFHKHIFSNAGCKRVHSKVAVYLQ